MLAILRIVQDIPNCQFIQPSIPSIAVKLNEKKFSQSTAKCFKVD